MTNDTTKTPAAAKQSRARGRADANGAKVAAMNAAAAEPTRTELVKQAAGLGIKGASAMKKAELEKAIKGAEQTAGIVGAVVESAKTGPNAEATHAASTTSTLASTDQVARRSKRGPRGEAARVKAAELGKRGPGRKLDDAELATYVAEVRKAHPESSMSDELEYAYWIKGLAVNRERFGRAWNGTSKARTARPVATPRKQTGKQRAKAAASA